MAPHPQSDPGPGRLHTPGLRPGIYNRIGSTQYRVIISRYMQRSSEALRSDREVNDRQIRMCRSWLRLRRRLPESAGPDWRQQAVTDDGHRYVEAMGASDDRLRYPSARCFL